MSTNQTKNLHLHSWDPLDRFTREEFNDNWAGIDAAWGDLEGRLLAEVEARSATAAALATETSERKAADTTLQNNINAKANASALTTETNERKSADTALSGRATSLESRVAALEAQMTQRPRIVSGSYKGNGEENKESFQAINIGFRPTVVIAGRDDSYQSLVNRSRIGIAVAGQDQKFNGCDFIKFTDTGFTVHNGVQGGNLNSMYYTYYYTALG